MASLIIIGIFTVSLTLKFRFYTTLNIFELSDVMAPRGIIFFFLFYVRKCGRNLDILN